jgi:origin recognition complex subunit 6
VYKKLYAFLERSLARSTVPAKRPANSSVSGTPTRPSSVTTTPAKDSLAGHTPSRVVTLKTPTKSTPLKRTYTGPNTPLSHLRKSAIRNTDPNAVDSMIKDAPAWVMSSIRNVCKIMANPVPGMSVWSRPAISKTFPPHIFAGVSSILHFVDTTPDDGLDEEYLELLSRLRSVKDAESEQYKKSAICLIVAVYFVVLAGRPSLDQTHQSYAESSQSGCLGSGKKKFDKKTFTEMRRTALTSAGSSPADLKQHCDDVDIWIVLIMKQNWAKGKEWFENIPAAEADGTIGGSNGSAAGGVSDGEDSDPVTTRRRKKRPEETSLSDVLNVVADSSSRGGLLPGLGTMMQDRIDWLSEERREDYREWKAGIMRRIEKMERKGKAAGTGAVFIRL